MRGQNFYDNLKEHQQDSVDCCLARRRFDAIDVSVEIAVCHILLGNAEAAGRALGLTKDAPRGPDPGIQQFVQVKKS